MQRMSTEKLVYKQEVVTEEGRSGVFFGSGLLGRVIS